MVSVESDGALFPYHVAHGQLVPLADGVQFYANLGFDAADDPNDLLLPAPDSISFLDHKHQATVNGLFDEPGSSSEVCYLFLL